MDSPKKLLVLIAIIISFNVSFAFSLSPAPAPKDSIIPIIGPLTHVKILNELEYYLTVHCKSREDDLGARTLSQGQSFGWKFRVNFPNTTLYFCGFTWVQGVGVFDIYKATRDRNRCTYCTWKARTDGVYGFGDVPKKASLFYPWDKLFT